MKSYGDIITTTYLRHNILFSMTFRWKIKIKAVTYLAALTKQTNRRQMVKILKYDNPYHKIKLKIRQVQILGKSTGQINNTACEWYIGS